MGQFLWITSNALVSIIFYHNQKVAQKETCLEQMQHS